jgi:hypothetical protein
MRRSWLPLVAVVAGACAVGQPAVPLNAFAAGDLATVEAFAAKEVADGPAENQALVHNVLGQCELLQGHVDAARRNFEIAGRIMGSWSTGGGEATGAILGSESSKTYRGDPYEQAMNAYYLALCFFWKGEPDNSRAACKRGMLADAEVGDEKFQADNALLFWLAGRFSILLGSDDADGYFGEAATAHAFAIEHGARGVPNNDVLANPRRGNLVLLLECGMGPEKFAEGGQDELARFRPRPHPAVAARASIDGRDLGVASLLLDVDYQARTLGGTEMEGIRKGKAVFKTASTVAGVVLLDQASRSHGDAARTQAIAGGVLLLAGLLTSTSADVRHWPTLPSTVHVLTADAPPGDHQLTIDFLDARGQPLPPFRQHTVVTVPASGEAWHLARSLPPVAPRVPSVP